MRCGKVWAASQGRAYVIPDDVKLLVPPVLEHRIILETEAEFAGATARQVLTRILAETPPPAARV